MHVAIELSLEDVLRTLGLEHAAGELDTASQKAITRNESRRSDREVE